MNKLYYNKINPGGAVQDLVININDKKVKNLKVSYFKWVVFTVWFGIILFLIYRAKGLNSVQPFYQTNYGISVYDSGSYIVYYMALAIFLILTSIIGNRGGCHTICWMSPFMITGNKIGRLIKLPSYRLSHTENLCISCGKCTKVCPMSLPVEEMVHKNNTSHSECISCAKCVDTCPKKVLDITWK